MKIGILIDRFNVGGVEKIALEQVAALLNQGIDAELVVLRRKSVVEDAFMDLRKNLKITYLDDRMPSFFRFSFKFPIFNFFSFFHISYACILPFFIQKKEYDYIICHGTFTSFTAISLKYLCGISFSAFIWDPIGYILEKVYSNKFPPLVFKLLVRMAKLLDSWIVREADEILVGGEAHNAYFQSISPEVKITTIAPSVHPIAKLPSSKRSSLLLVTAWKEGKQPEYLFELLKHVPDAQFLLVGKWLDAEYKQNFERSVREYGFSQNIKVIGAVSEKQLSRQYAKAQVLLQVNDDRGFGMPALEAAAHGTPFIIPKGQGVCELFEHGVHGYYTAEKDTTEISKYLNMLLKNQKKAQKMSRECFNRVKENYSWDSHARDLMLVCKRNT